MASVEDLPLRRGLAPVPVDGRPSASTRMAPDSTLDGNLRGSVPATPELGIRIGGAAARQRLRRRSLLRRPDVVWRLVCLAGAAGVLALALLPPPLRSPAAGG